MADANIFSEYLRPVRSVADYSADMDKRETDQLALQQTRQNASDEAAIRSAYQQSAGDYNKMLPILAASGQHKAVDAITKAIADRAKSAADLRHVDSQTDKEKALAGKDSQDTIDKALAMSRSFVNQVDTPQAAASYVRGLYAHPVLGPISSNILPMDQALQSIPQDMNSPEGLRWKAAHANISGKDLMAYLMPKEDQVNLGGSMSFGNRDQFSGARTQVGSAPITETAEGIANRLNAVKTTGMNNATSRANNRDTIASENMRAGVSADGSTDPNSERTAQAIASGQLPAPTGMALLNPKNQRILGRVMEINPSYDFTDVSAKKKAASDFTSGTLGNSMRSFAVAGQHLDQLGTLVDALGNGNINLINKVGNAYATQTGNAAPTNFEAAKDVVSKEVVKAIVAGGGGVTERQELSNLMSNARSPAQLKGIISQYRNLMSAQHDALLQQRRAAGLKDSSLPDYKDANSSANAPAGGSKNVNFGDLK